MTRFRRTLLTGAAAGFLCLCAVLCAVAQDVFLRPAMEAFVDKDTLLVFPAQIDTFQKVRVRKNENPVFGTVVRYENELGSCADVYIYSLDTAAKPVQQDAYEKHCLETDQGILNLSAQNPKIKVEHIEAPGRKAPEGGYEMFYRIQNGSTRMDSVLFLALYKGKLVKVRISYSSEDIEEPVHAGFFVDAVAAMLNKEKAASKKPEAQPQDAPETQARPRQDNPETQADTAPKSAAQP
ncbi:MAG: hypothetical protein IKP09_06810 [Lentisphaeria bacterium]|nr:hypothetical protein [Lentisphaeria bacterium]